MWRVIRFIAGALVLLFAASQSSAQTYSANCETCELISVGPIDVRTPFCLDADYGGRGNSGCRTRVEVSFGIPRLSCAYVGDPCNPMQGIGTYQAFWTQQLLFGFMLSGGGGGFGCCEPDGTDWCAVWGMPSGCT